MEGKTRQRKGRREEKGRGIHFLDLKGNHSDDTRSIIGTSVAIETTIIAFYCVTEIPLEVVATATILMLTVMLWFEVLVGCIGTYAVILRRRRRGWTLFKRILFVGKGLIYSLTGAYSKLADLLKLFLAGLCDQAYKAMANG